MSIKLRDYNLLFRSIRILLSNCVICMCKKPTMKYFYLFFSLTLLISCGEKKTEKTETLEEKAQRIHDSVVTIDTHDDINCHNITII